MKETAVQFGGAPPLVGIVTDPASPPRRASPAVLLLNAGLLHRIGPCRAHVRLARRLAASGFTVLRLDFSGIGDSEARRNGLGREEATLREGREAINFLATTRGAESFVVMGLCWGAANAFRLTRDDARVAGAVLIDGYAYRTSRYHARHLRRRMLSWHKWRNLMTGRSESGRQLMRLLGREIDDPVGPPGGVSYVRSFPPKQAVLSDLRAMLERGVRLFLLYSEFGMEEYYNYPEQFFDIFPSLSAHPQLRAELFRGADHTFTLRRHQEELIGLIEGWMTTAFGEPAGALRAEPRPSV